MTVKELIEELEKVENKNLQIRIHGTGPDGWTYYNAVPQPPINTWEDFYNHDWSKQDTVKFLTQPLKYMSILSAKRVITHLKNTIS